MAEANRHDRCPVRTSRGRARTQSGYALRKSQPDRRDLSRSCAPHPIAVRNCSAPFGSVSSAWAPPPVTTSGPLGEVAITRSSQAYVRRESSIIVAAT